MVKIITAAEAANLIEEAATIATSGFVGSAGLRGGINPKTIQDLVEVIELGNEEWLWYKPFPIDVALIRDTTADENGNISIEKECVSLELLSIAQVARNSGGIVIVQVERVVKSGSIMHPMNLKVPGIVVDYIGSALSI